MEMKFSFPRMDGDNVVLAVTKNGKATYEGLRLTQYELSQLYEAKTSAEGEGTYVFKQLSAMVNKFSCGDAEKAFLEAFKKEHPTLKQSEVRLFLRLMDWLAENGNEDDLRQKASVLLAKKIQKCSKETILPFI